MRVPHRFATFRAEAEGAMLRVVTILNSVYAPGERAEPVAFEAMMQARYAAAVENGALVPLDEPVFDGLSAAQAFRHVHIGEAEYHATTNWVVDGQNYEVQFMLWQAEGRRRATVWEALWAAVRSVEPLAGAVSRPDSPHPAAGG